MKKYKLKQWAEDFIICLTITTFFFTGLCFISYSVKQYDSRMIDEEIKKTEMSGTQISQN